MAYAYKEGADYAHWYALNPDNNKYRKTSTTNGNITITEVNSLPSGTSSITQTEYNTMCSTLDSGERLGSHPGIIRK